MIDYNGYDGTTNPPTPGNVPEFYWFLFARWSSYNGGNEWDIDSDGDSLVNGLDIDQDADGLPDWWDQDEGNDGIMDVNDVKMGGTFNLSVCGHTVGNLGQGFVCGYDYAIAYQMPLNGVNAQFGLPYSTRPDAAVDQGATAGGASGNWSCTPGAQGGCWHYDFGGDGVVDSDSTGSTLSTNGGQNDVCTQCTQQSIGLKVSESALKESLPNGVFGILTPSGYSGCSTVATAPAACACSLAIYLHRI